MRSLDQATALSVAVVEGHIKIVQRLLDMHANVHHLGPDGESLLIMATDRGHVEIVRQLLRAGVDIDSIDDKGDTVLHHAASNGSCALADVLLAADRLELERTNWFDDTPLMQAVKRGHVDFVEHLLWLGVAVNHVDEDNLSALHEASEVGNVVVVEMLLTTGELDVNQITIHHDTPLMRAADIKNGLLFDILLAHGATVDPPCDNTSSPQHQSTALLDATVMGNIDAVAGLLASNADVNAIEVHCNSALIVASSRGYTDVVELLLRNEIVDIQYVNSFGQNALIPAAAYGLVRIVEQLIAAGIDATVIDRYGRTALSMAGSSTAATKNEVLTLLHTLQG